MAPLQSSQRLRRHHQPANIDHHHHQATSPQPQQQAPPFLQPPPLYRMSRGIKIITDLHREWYDGFAGGYPVETLKRL
ncbi:hypothetical protein [Absidia glauca]|uniref:Uncharacterized protein n=1 Tax=Absidia glauca TaxID=4829 RepID=A0A163JLY3_ABSGL|nr:hypothetical protein [Absidia glauca]